MTGRLSAALILGLAWPAQAFDGRFGDCAAPGGARDVVISGDAIRWDGSECRLTDPTLVRDMPGAVLFDLVCEGEGETWTERAFLQRTLDGGLILVARGRAHTLPFCG